eukprot:GILJ01008400.1.p1 GENE.GILJ01008400.1~~GILJ01008400.1.p1  ORF type:complete len:552 (-),score=62.40 GILJ01008400.1:95-1630(-)
MQAEIMTVDHYQRLIDRGWRRSGTWLYKPSNDKACCVQHTIRLDVRQFVPTKKQAQIVSKVHRTVAHFETPSEAPLTGTTDEVAMEDDRTSDSNSDHGARDGNLVSELTELLRRVVLTAASSFSLPAERFDPNKVQVRESTGKQKLLADFSSPVAIQLAASCKKAGVPVDGVTQLANRIAAELAPMEAGAFGRVDSILDVSVSDNGYLNFKLKSPEIVMPDLGSEQSGGKSKQKVNEHKSNHPKTTPSSRLESILDHINKMEQDGDLTVSTVPSSFSEEEFEVYVRYQTVVHHDRRDKLSVKQYTNFLVESPLIPEPFPTGEGVGYGSFHQIYRTRKGQIVAVGVVDILPKCLSSVYLFYDPTFSKFSPGIYSAIREIYTVQQLSALAPSLHYYYMGFYIHTCPKMRYKGDYHPSELLCPITQTWVPLDKCIPLLETRKYGKLAAEDTTEYKLDESTVGSALNRIPILLPSGECRLPQLMEASQEVLKSPLSQYVTRVGPELASEIHLSFG